MSGVWTNREALGSPTVLGRTRRFARLLACDAAGGDQLVQHYLADNPQIDIAAPGSDEVMKPIFAELVTVMYVTELAYFREILPAREERALREIETLSQREREIFALTRVEGLTIGEAAMILGFDEDDADEIDADVEREAFSFKRRLLIVEGDEERASVYDDALSEIALIAMRAPGALRAIETGSRSPLDLIIIDAADERYEELLDSLVFGEGGVPTLLGSEYFEPWLGKKFEADVDGDEVIFSSSHPQSSDVDTDGTLNHAMLFASGKFKERVQSMLYVEPHLWTDPDSSFEHLKTIEEVSDEALAPATAPIDAVVVDDQLQSARGVLPDSVVAFSALDALRRQLLENARYQAQEVGASNAAPRVKSHVEAILPLLDQPLTEGMVLGLAVGIDGLARLLPIIEEEFTRLAAVDIAGFIVDLQRFTNQFPVFRQFNSEASADRSIKPDEEVALQSVVSAVIEQPDDVVAAELKEQFATLQAGRAKQAGSAIGDVAWVRSISNALKAVAREVKLVASETGKDARGRIAKGLGALVVALPLAAGLQLLGARFPTEFAALTLLLTQSREQIKQTLGEDADDKP